MVRFTPSKPAPNYLGRREQRRLLTMVFLLGLVFFLMRETREPRNWDWFFLLTQQPHQAAPETVAGIDIDTRLKTVDLPEAVEGAFISPLPKPPPQLGEKAYFPGVQPELFADVRDDTVSRAAELPSYLNLLEVLQNTSDEALAQASSGPVAFVQLFEQPDEFRGELVSLRGKLRRIEKVPAPKNDLGLESYYQAWLQPYDNRNALIVIYTLYLPHDFPLGDRIAEEVELTGFSYKRWAYRATDTIRTAPMVLARNMHWIRPTAVAKQEHSSWEFAAIVTGALLIAGIFVSMMLSKQKPAAAGRGFQLPSRTGTRDLPPTGEEFQRMLEEAERNEPTR